MAYGKLLLLALPVLLAVVVYIKLLPAERLILRDAVNINTTRYWGKGERPAQIDDGLKPFTVTVEQNILDDLKVRLKNTRYFEPVEGSPWDYGQKPAFMRELVDYWINEYNWDKHQAALNAYDQFKTNIDGIDVHFLHVKGKAPKGQTNTPLLLIHGWPGSVLEFYEILPYLIDPAAHGGNASLAFDLVIPSLPGYGFSSKAYKRGMDQVEMGLIFAKLMKRLGYDKYIVQGGDWGGVIAKAVAGINPENCIGVHVNFYLPYITRSEIWHVTKALLTSPESAGFTKFHAAQFFPLSAFAKNFYGESGYFHEQSTRPYTLASGLTDSPVGLAAWISEKFRVWSDCNGDVYKRFTKDELLTNIMIYWVTNTISSSVNLYKEWADSVNLPALIESPVDIPSGIIEFPKEIYSLPREWVANLFRNIVSYTVAEKGGHFAAMEEPAVLAEDLWRFNHLVSKS